MSAFGDGIARFSLKVEARSKAVFVRVVELTRDSIVEGSAITGAPGQPVGQYGPGYHPGEVGGTLKASWETVFDNDAKPTEAIIGTKVKYAEPIEDGVGKYGPLTLRSTQGGFHSCKMTVAGFPRIVAAAAAEVSG